MIYADAYHPLYSRRLYIIARALPCLVPGCRLVPSKIAASGARALLAMTNLAGFEGKRNVDSGWKRLYPTKNVRFPNKTVPISCHCEAAERPWQSLSQRHCIPWRSTGAENDKIPRGRSEFHCKTIFTCPMGKFHMRSIFHLLKEQISLRSHARPKAEFHCAVRTVPYRVRRKERSPQIDFAATVWSFY